MPETNYQKDYSDFTGLIPPFTKPHSGCLAKEIDDSAIGTTLNHIETNDASDKCDIWFDNVLSGGDETILDGIVAVHTGCPFCALMPTLLESPLLPIDEGVSGVIVNGRPAIECQPAITGFAGARMCWPEVGPIYTKVCAVVQFILKAEGTGSNIRLVLKAGSNATGFDSSAPFSSVEISVVPVNFNTIGEIFEGVVKLSRTSFNEGSPVAIQLGRDGNSEVGSGIDDDVDVAIQIIAVTMAVE